MRALTEVDHVDREALVASPSESWHTIIGVPRFVRDRHDATTADLAITVADEWHGRGLGTGLLRLLSRRASEVGIAHFTADMLAENRAVLALVRAAGGVPRGSTGSTVTSQIDLDSERSGKEGEALNRPLPCALAGRAGLRAGPERRSRCASRARPPHPGG